MGTAYKYFGKPDSRDAFDSSTDRGIPGEYNYRGFYSQARFNDVIIHCPPFGTDVANAVIWTPSVRRDEILTDDIPKTPYQEFAIEEFLGFTASNWPYTSLEAAGICLYIKLKNETGVDEGLVREEKGPYQVVKRTAGVCAADGAIKQIGIGNTFGWTLGWAMCLGLRMDKSNASLGGDNQSAGWYHYYVVNRNSGNEREIVWRILFTVGMRSTGNYSTFTAPLGGATLPPGTYYLSNPYPNDVGRFVPGIVTKDYPLGTGFTFINSLVDEQLSRASNWGNSYGILAIDYSNFNLYPSPSGQTWGTDNPLVDIASVDPDYRPYQINSVPLI
jgi:hypothetical protein